MKEFKTHQSSMIRDGCHPQFVALPGVGGVWGKCFVQPLIYLSDERYEHTLPYIKGAVFVFSSRRSKTRLCKLNIFAMQATAKYI